MAEPTAAHTFGCALVTRGGACDCRPAPVREWARESDLRHTGRGFTYDLGQMLGEGHYVGGECD